MSAGTMKAVVQRRSGGPRRLGVERVALPQPGAGEILVQVVAATVTRGDVVMRKMPKAVARLFGETPKAIPGTEFAGVISEVGARVEGFARGDRVFGTTAGLSAGSHAQYLVVPEDGLVASIPSGVGFGEAAAVPVGATTALGFLSQAGVGSGSRVLINGASGSVGSFAVQIASHLGGRVVGVASARNMDLVRSLGADEAVDYTSTDLGRLGSFDVVFDTAGTLQRRAVDRMIEDGGRFVSTRMRREESRAELLAAASMLADGIIEPLVDRTFPLEDIAAAHRYVEDGRKRGNVLLDVAMPAAQGEEGL